MLNWKVKRKINHQNKRKVFINLQNIPLMKPHQIHTWMGRIGLVVNHAIVWLLLVQLHKCSEFPERECCDPIYPSIPELEYLPQQTTTLASSSSPYAAGTGVIGNTGRSGEFMKLLHCQSVQRRLFLARRKSFIQFNSSRGFDSLSFWYRISISNLKLFYVLVLDWH